MSAMDTVGLFFTVLSVGVVAAAVLIAAAVGALTLYRWARRGYEAEAHEIENVSAVRLAQAVTNEESHAARFGRQVNNVVDRWAKSEISDQRAFADIQAMRTGRADSIGE